MGSRTGQADSARQSEAPTAASQSCFDVACLLPRLILQDKVVKKASKTDSTMVSKTMRP